MSDITLLDGSIGQELVNRFPSKPTRLWGVKVMIDAPEILRDVHLDYFKAGATVATLNTYNLHQDRLAPLGMEDQLDSLHLQASKIGQEARDQHGSGKIAVSLGPLGASYRPDLAPALEEAAEQFAHITRLHESSADIILIETASSIQTARGALMGASVSNKPIWLALSVEDSDGTRLRSGEPIADVYDALSDLRCDRFLLNCSTPEAFDQAYGVLDAALQFGAYANGFTSIVEEFREAGQVVDVLKARKDLGPEAYAKFAMNWIDQGARTIGGCCEVGPSHIAELARQIRAAGHTIV